MPTPSGHTKAIQATRVIGTTVKDQYGETIGQIEDIVLDKMSNDIMFVVIGFGGFLGIGEKYHAVPWAALDYDPADAAFIAPYTREQLAAAPHDTISELTRNDGIGYRDAAHSYYRVS